MVLLGRVVILAMGMLTSRALTITERRTVSRQSCWKAAGGPLRLRLLMARSLLFVSLVDPKGLKILTVPQPPSGGTRNSLGQ